MKIKVSETTNTQLNWLVATCESIPSLHIVQKPGKICVYGEISGIDFPYQPSTDWSQGGPLIERERIRLEPLPDKGWRAYLPVNQGLWVDAWGDRAKPLRVAMECFVANKLGELVEVPDELYE